jgi:phospholipase C
MSHQMSKLSALGILAALAVIVAVAGTAQPRAGAAPIPITHVVIVFQENHSFDNVLGKLCVLDSRCNGATTGKVHTGQSFALGQATDLIPEVKHKRISQETAINGGGMNGFDLLQGCHQSDGFACYTQFDPSQIPNLASLARGYALSDATFANGPYSSFVSHLTLVAGGTDGFYGENPNTGTVPPGPGWGCDSNLDALWVGPTGNINVPSCVPDLAGQGPYRSSPVPYAPTIMSRLDAKGLTWKLYSGLGPGRTGTGSGILWESCTYFYECTSTSQAANWVPAAKFLQDAAAGTLPNLSVITPTGKYSQHNQNSMATGDNWIGKVADAVGGSPAWSSTAIFITYDECGCFYDHASPPTGRGIRIPMVIVSPWVKSGFTDSQNAVLASMLSFTEKLFGLSPLTNEDGTAYAYGNAFDFQQTPLPPPVMTITKISEAERRYIASHPPDLSDER